MNKQEEIARGSARASGKPLSKKLFRERPRIITFHPTRDERQALAAGAMPPEDVYSTLAKVIERNCGLALGYDMDRGNFYAIMRDKSQEWSEALACSAFHSDLYKAVQGLAFALHHKWPRFPEEVQLELPTSDEW